MVSKPANHIETNQQIVSANI